MARRGKEFWVDTSPTKEVVVNSLTKDAPIEVCIFDLVDNSIDAARDTIFQSVPPESRPTLPESYEGFHIDLTISGDGVKIKDNCGGIPIEPLKTMVLRFGRRSAHPLGIGVFGVGLNRAMFRLGQVSRLTTDTGKQRAELVLKNKDYLKSNDWNLPAVEFQSTGEVGTEIEIGHPTDEIAQQLADLRWVQDVRHEIGRRYGRFIAKRLLIRVGGVAVPGQEVPIREDGPYEGEHKFYRTEDGVFIIVQYGQHRDHRFKKEVGYDHKRNTAIVDQFGWTVYCNDRAVKFADRTDKTGWETKFHTEFYGFVGSASFVGEPSKLPWNTLKTDVDLNNPAYRMALKDMRLFTAKWKTIADKRKREPTPKSIPPKAPTPPDPPKPGASGAAARSGPTKAGPVVVPIRKPDHHQFRTVLPADVDERHCVDKHLKVVHEAKDLDLGEFGYAGLALIRMLFEFSVSHHLHRHGKYPELRQFAIDRRRSKGMKIAPADEKNVLPSVDEMIPYLEMNPSVWGAKEAHLRHSLKRFAAHQQTFNSALHNPFQPIEKSRMFDIRDEVLPLLRHLIET